MSKLTIVKFLKPWNGYAPDEIAGFPADKADQLVAGEVAELHGKKSKAPPAGGDKKDPPAPPAPPAPPVADDEKP